MERAFLAELAAQDALLERRRLAVWIGAEPTFTDPRSQHPWWLSEAEGGDKLERARALLRSLAARLGGRARLSSIEGRHFPGEPAPRFCLAARVEAAAPPGPIDDAALDAPPGPRPAIGEGEALFTVTPDPGVVEVNLAPAPDLVTFHRWCTAVHAAAEDAGLSPVRFRYNGDATDSGGGGQLTFGGPTPETSPFFLRPRLLPRLVRYLSNHPALSYAFAGECLGSASQGPRPDEGARERYEELQVAVDRLDADGAHAAPAELWETLAPLLVDASGNSHRAELNVEKLWNPHLPGRGRLGVVELRALRMPPSPRRQAAIAALFRAVLARLVDAGHEPPLAEWGAALHDRFALPVFLEEDLRAVLDDLGARGLGPGPITAATLLERPPPLATVELAGASLTVSPALEFWPLFGDVASQERSAARVVDASTRRIEVLVAHRAGERPGRLTAGGWEVPLHRAGGGHVAAIRWRVFAPRPGLHPGIPAIDPLVLGWEKDGQRIAVELHGWIPGGGVYDGLPADADVAAMRRRERVRIVRAAGPFSARRPPPTAGFTLDLRRLDPAGAAPALTLAGGQP